MMMKRPRRRKQINVVYSGRSSDPTCTLNRASFARNQTTCTDAIHSLRNMAGYENEKEKEQSVTLFGGNEYARPVACADQRCALLLASPRLTTCLQEVVNWRLDGQR